MFSVQQLIKATRRLQANASSSADLSKNLKCVAVAGSNHNQSQQQPSVEVSSGSLWSAHDLTTLSSVSASTSSPASSSSTSSSPSLSSPQQQPQHQQQLLHATSENHILYNSKTSQESDDNNINISKISLCSHLNESGSQSLLPTHDSTAQNRKLNSATATTPTPKTPQHSCSRSQQIQNFYQQQLHQFHTQHNQSLWAKQKQTHFTMSSLAAAAEPLSPLKPADCSGAVASNGDQSAKLDGDDVAEGSAPAAAAKSGKTCFKSGLGEILRFMELIGNLKHTKRTGWVLRDVNDCESISGHMYRMSMMTFLLDGTEGLNAIRCMELALVHDLAESIVGDLTPFCGISKEEKRAMEFKAMDDICKLIEPRGKRIMKLFEEYETGVSEESKFVKDLDRLDMVMQAFEYEKRDNCLLKHQEFFNSTEGKFKHPFIKQLVKEIYEQRSSLAKERGATPPPHVIEVPDWENSSSAATNGHCRTKDSAEEQQANEASSSSSTS